MKLVFGGSDLVGAHGETAKNGVVEDQVGVKLGFTNSGLFLHLLECSKNFRYEKNDCIIGSRIYRCGRKGPLLLDHAIFADPQSDHI